MDGLAVRSYLPLARRTDTRTKKTITCSFLNDII